MLRPDFEAFKNKKNPKEEDYQDLINFTEGVINLFLKERRARSAISKKRKKLEELLKESKMENNRSISG